MYKNSKNNKVVSVDKKNENGIFKKYSLPNYLNQILDYIQNKKGIVYVTAVVHITKKPFSFDICSDVTYKHSNGSVDVELDVLQSGLLIDSIPIQIKKIIESESEYSCGFTFEDLQKYFDRGEITVERVKKMSDIITKRPENTKKIVVKDEFFYTTIEYFDNQGMMDSCMYVEYLTDIPENNSPYPLGEISIENL